MALGAPWCPLVPQNAIGVIKVNDFQKHVPEGVRASMREPRKTTLSSQIPGATARLRKSWRLPFGALGFPRETSTRPLAHSTALCGQNTCGQKGRAKTNLTKRRIRHNGKGIHTKTSVSHRRNAFQKARGTTGTPQVTHGI